MTTDASKMSDKELDRAIAEAVGIKPERYFRRSVWIYGGVMNDTPPRYTADLNACAQTYQGLTEAQRHMFCIIATAEIWPQGWQDWRNTAAFAELLTNPRKFAEFLYLTLSK